MLRATSRRQKKESSTCNFNVILSCKPEENIDGNTNMSENRLAWPIKDRRT